MIDNIVSDYNNDVKKRQFDDDVIYNTSLLSHKYYMLIGFSEIRKISVYKSTVNVQTPQVKLVFFIIINIKIHLK